MFHVPHLLSSQERIHADLFPSLSSEMQKEQKFRMTRGRCITSARLLMNQDMMQIALSSTRSVVTFTVLSCSS